MSAAGSPPELRTVALPSGPLAYRVAGQGPDLLLLHGWMCSGRLWLAMLPALSRSYRCWMPDLPGCGDSPLARQTPLTLPDDCRAVFEFGAALGIQPQAVIGHSLGGLLTLLLALERPEWARRLVLLAPVVSGRLALHLDALLRGPVGRGGIRVWRPVRRIAARAFIPFTFGVKPQFFGSAAARRKAEDADRTAWAAALGGLSGAIETDVSARLAGIGLPTLVIVGAHDLTIPPSEGARAAALIPNARLVRLPGVAHQLPDEAPEIVADLILDFLERQEAGRQEAGKSI